MNQKIYLDNNGSTFLDPAVRDLLISSLQLKMGNPSSIHSFGKEAKSELFRARDSIAHYLRVKPAELVFTSGGTENANMVLRGVFAEKPDGHLITSAVEHACVYSTAQILEKSGTSVTYLLPGTIGAVSPQAVKEAIRPNTSLIALMAVNNETGVKTDIEAIAKIADQHRIPFFVDGVALLGKEPFTIHKGISAMSFSGHKIHAPQGTGVLFIRSGFKLQPIITGGEQEYGRRSGTENMLGILALAKAFELLKSNLTEASERMMQLRDQFEKIILQRLPDVFINGDGPRTANVSNLAFSGIDGESLLIALDNAGLSASHGSACSSGASEPSRILVNMGLPSQIVLSSIRFSLSRFTTEGEIEQAVNLICSIVERMRRR